LWFRLSAISSSDIPFSSIRLILANRAAAHHPLRHATPRTSLVDLSRAESNIGYCIEHKSWWKTTGLSPRMDPSDRRLVLGELDSNGFYAVDLAEGAIDHWYGIRNYELGRQEGYNTDTIRTQIDKLEEIVGWIEEARKHLRAFTGDPESIAEPEAEDDPKAAMEQPPSTSGPHESTEPPKTA
jgi:hypothetical protein